MTIEEALDVLDRVLHESLNDTQESVFRQAWAGQSYPEIAQDLNYTTEYIRAVGAQLWRSLSKKLGEQVTMRNFRRVLRRWAERNSDIKKPPQPTLQRQDWGEAVDVSTFFGRTDELAILEQWIVHDRCRLVALLGMGGIGKTSLSVRLAQQIQTEFDCLIWRSLRNAPPLQELLVSLLQFLLGGEDLELPKDANQQLSQLIRWLHDQRCLIILDNVEVIFHSDNCSSSANHHAGQYREGYENYGELFKQISEIPHQSCLLLTSREEPKEVDIQKGKTEPVRAFQLPGLTSHIGQKLFKIRGNFSASEADWKQLIHHYAGNPLALKIVASVIRDLFDSDVSKFLDLLQQGMLVFDDIRDLLRHQFECLSNDEKEIMYWLAIHRELVDLSVLQHDIISPISQHQLPEALRSLGRRFLIEKSPRGFTQQPVVMEYVLEQFIEQVCQEICAENINLLMSHALIKAQAKSYIRESQVRLILAPIVDRLCALLHSTKAVETKLKQILLKLQTEFTLSPGYAAGNLINLLHQLKIDLTNYDFSNLAVWQAYLQGVQLHQVNFANCNLSRSVFTETLGNIWAVAFSPDANLLAASDTASEIHIWQVQDGKKLLTCSGHKNWAACVAFSPDSNILASGSADNTIKLWDASTGQCLRTLRGHTDWILSVAFSPDGQLLTSSSADHTIKVWHITTGACLHTLEGHTNWVRSIAFSPSLPSTTLLASGSADDTLKLWDVASGQCLQTFSADSNGIWSIAFSPDGQTLATGGADATIKLWQIDAGQCFGILRGHTSHVRSVAFNGDGSRIVSGSEDQTIRLWDVTLAGTPHEHNSHKHSAHENSLHEHSEKWFNGECFKVLQGHTSAVWSVACSGTTLFASGSLDQRVKLWDIRTGQCLTTLQGYTDFVWSIAFQDPSPTVASPLLASGSADHSIKLWDTSSGQCLKTLQGHTNWVLSVAFSPNSSTLASGSFDQTIRLWDSRNGACLRVLRGHTNWVLSVKFSPDATLLGSGSFDGTVKLWDLHTGECLRTLHGHEGRIWSIAFSPDSQLVASASEDQTIRLWQARTGECLHVLTGHIGRVWCIAFHPNGEYVASGSKDQTIRIWDSNTGKCLHVLQGHTSRVQSVAFSPDGNLLASGSEDKTVKLWNCQTGECIKTLEGHTNCVWSVAFGQVGAIAQNQASQPSSNDFQQILASGGEDETIRFWDIATGKCLRILKGPRPYQDLNIAGVSGLTDAQKLTLKALGAIDTSDMR